MESIAVWSARIPFATRCPLTTSHRKSILSKSPSKIIVLVAKPSSVTLVVIFNLLRSKDLGQASRHLARLSRKRFRLRQKTLYCRTSPEHLLQQHRWRNSSKVTPPIRTPPRNKARRHAPNYADASHGTVPYEQEFNADVP
jgi:hypothetical protein